MVHYLAELPSRSLNKDSTRQNAKWILDRYRSRIGHRLVGEITITVLQQIFDRQADSAYVNHRKVWMKFGDWLVAKGRWQENRARKTLAKQVRRKRARHTDIGYQAIYNAADEWLQIAMELAVSSLQDRTVLLELERSDIVDGRIRLTRHKTGANLAILPGKRLKRAIDRALAVPIAGETLIRRVPERRRPGPDWWRVRPLYLSHAFSATREASGAYANLEPEERPDFRALRSYGAKLYADAGHPRAYVQALLAHRDTDLTKYYQESGYQTSYVDVEAGL